MRWITVAVFVLIAAAAPPPRCKYSVRDVGFVDLESDGYRLVLFSGDADAAAARTYRDAATAYLLDTNVRLERVLDGEAVPGVRREDARADATVRALLVAPDGRSLDVSVGDKDHPADEDGIWRAVESVVASPVRARVLANLLEAHSFVLVFEGTDPLANERAVRVVASAVATTTESMPRLPKPPAAPPQVITIPVTARVEERVLLFALGMEDASREDAHLAVLMGRARKLGPVLTVPGIAARDLEQSLSTVGQDCECGLDRSWMQGPMVPLTFDEEHQAAAVKVLGFDVGNPLVKAEISRILAKGGSGVPGQGEQDSLLGYSEVVVGNTGEADVPVVVGEAVSETAALPPPKTSMTTAFVWGVVGLTALVFLGALWVVLWARRN